MSNKSDDQFLGSPCYFLSICRVCMLTCLITSFLPLLSKIKRVQVYCMQLLEFIVEGEGLYYLKFKRMQLDCNF